MLVALVIKHRPGVDNNESHREITKNCLKIKEYLGWALPRLGRRF